MVILKRVTKRPGRPKDEANHGDAEGRIDVHLVLPLSEPDDQSRDDDDDGAEGIRKNVEENAAHV